MEVLSLIVSSCRLCVSTAWLVVLLLFSCSILLCCCGNAKHYSMKLIVESKNIFLSVFLNSIIGMHSSFS